MELLATRALRFNEARTTVSTIPFITRLEILYLEMQHV